MPKHRRAREAWLRPSAALDIGPLQHIGARRHPPQLQQRGELHKLCLGQGSARLINSLTEILPRARQWTSFHAAVAKMRSSGAAILMMASTSSTCFFLTSPSMVTVHGRVPDSLPARQARTCRWKGRNSRRSRRLRLGRHRSAVEKGPSPCRPFWRRPAPPTRRTLVRAIRTPAATAVSPPAPRPPETSAGSVRLFGVISKIEYPPLS